MQEILIRLIGREDASDINIKNEPFKLLGECYQFIRIVYIKVVGKYLLEI